MGFIRNLIQKHENEKYEIELREELKTAIQDFDNFKTEICKLLRLEHFRDDIFMELAGKAEQSIHTSVFIWGYSEEICNLHHILNHIKKSLEYINKYHKIWLKFIQKFNINTTLLIAFVDVCEIETKGKFQHVLPEDLMTFIDNVFIESKTKHEFFNGIIRDVEFFDLKSCWKSQQEVIFC